MVAGPKMRWGTWEELILGGAVLRHGTDDWNVVALELRARTIYPNKFTPQACKARYEDLRKQYSGCNFWFEELRKKRIEELKRELEKSEGSIGSLKSKIEILKAEKERSSQTESPVAVVKSEGNEVFSKEVSKDGLSAGSFTQNMRTNESHECQIPALISATETESKIEGSQNSEQKKNGGTMRKIRGKRKRKDGIWDSKEGSIGESENMCSTSAVSISPIKKASLVCDQTRRHSNSKSNMDNHKGSLCSMKKNGLMDIFNSIARREPALVFRHRLDSQKRARYKKIIKRHMDIETIRSRLVSLSIRSSVELFRDLLLLANNALVFYSKRTREYKAALALRDLVTKIYRQHYRCCSYNKATFSLLPLPTLCCPPVKPRSARPRPCKGRIPDVPGSLEGQKRLFVADSVSPLQLPLTAKKGIKQPGKTKRGPVTQVWRHRGLEKEDSQQKTVSKDSQQKTVSKDSQQKTVSKYSQQKTVSKDSQQKTVSKKEVGTKPVLKERKMTRQRLN